MPMFSTLRVRTVSNLLRLGRITWLHASRCTQRHPDRFPAVGHDQQTIVRRWQVRVVDSEAPVAQVSRLVSVSYVQCRGLVALVAWYQCGHLSSPLACCDSHISSPPG